MMGNGRGFLERIGVKRFELALVGVAYCLCRCRCRRDRCHGKSDNENAGRCKQNLTYRHVLTFSAVARRAVLQYRQLWPIHVARVWLPRKPPGLRDGAPITSFTPGSNKRVTLNGSAGWRNSRPMFLSWVQAWWASAPPCTCSSGDGTSFWSTGT